MYEEVIFVNDEKLLIISDDAPLADDLKKRVSQQFTQIQWIETSEIKREIVRLKPDIIILHESKESTCIQYLPYLTKEVPESLTVFLTEQRDPIRTRDVNRAGAFDILFHPEEINALEDTLSRAIKAFRNKSARDEVAASFSWAEGQVLAFYSGKGGSGCSLIASTLAQTLGLDSSASVLLVDLNLQYGGLETILQVNKGRSIHDLIPVISELNDNHIRSVTALEPKSQVEVLASPADAEIAEDIKEDHVQRLLRSARLYYDYILVDLPSEMTPITYTVLEEADYICYPMIPNMLSMKVLDRVLDVFTKLNIDTSERFHLILNRMSREVELREKDVKKYFAFPVAATLRDDTKQIQQSINQEKLIRNKRKERGSSVFTRDVQRLAGWLLSQNSKNHSA